MDIVDNVGDAQPSEEQPQDVAGVAYDEASFDNAWRSFYVQNMETLENVFRQVGEGIMGQMGLQDPTFDPDNNEEHKAAFEAAVRDNVPPAAEPYIMGVINGGMVVFLDIARRYGFKMDDIQATLKKLNPNAETEKPTKEQINGSEVQEPVQEETPGA